MIPIMKTRDRLNYILSNFNQELSSFIVIELPTIDKKYIYIYIYIYISNEKF